MRRFTLEERVARLERILYRKNEFLGIGKLRAKDEEAFIKKLFDAYESLPKIFGSYKSNKKKDAPFHIVLTANNKPYNGISFIISTKNDRKDVYVNATDSSGATLGVIKNLNIDTDSNKIASFILNTLSNNSDSSNESKQRRKYENVPLTTFDCESIKQMLEDCFDDLPEIEIDVTDDNSDYGFVNVGIYNPEYVTSYDIIVNDAKSVEIEHEDKKVGTAKSIEDAADMLADHFMEDYINGKYNKEKK